MNAFPLRSPVRRCWRCFGALWRCVLHPAPTLSQPIAGSQPATAVTSSTIHIRSGSRVWGEGKAAPITTGVQSTEEGEERWGGWSAPLNHWVAASRPRRLRPRGLACISAFRLLGACRSLRSRNEKLKAQIVVEGVLGPSVPLLAPIVWVETCEIVRNRDGGSSRSVDRGVK